MFLMDQSLANTSSISISHTITIAQGGSVSDETSICNRCSSSYNRGSSYNWSGNSMSIDCSGNRGNVIDGWSSVRASDEGCSRGAGSGSWLVGLHGGTESQFISYIVYSPSSAIDIVDGVGSLLVAVTITYFRSGVGSSKFVNDIIIESVVSISILCSGTGTDTSTDKGCLQKNIGMGSCKSSAQENNLCDHDGSLIS
ncbi:hypothetical protein X975_19726, partial [Stegodyphus mimosarum]